MPRFVILEHHHHGVHWDFMLESGDALRTWRLAEAPAADRTIAATLLPDHRRMYLDYEGEVSGGRGHVLRWDWGEFEWIADLPQSLELTLHGQRAKGRVYLGTGESGCTFRLTPLESDSLESAVR